MHSVVCSIRVGLNQVLSGPVNQSARLANRAGFFFLAHTYATHAYIEHTHEEQQEQQQQEEEEVQVLERSLPTPIEAKVITMG